MPSHTVHSALIQMGLDADNAPWNFDQWKVITGVTHGLFPTDDKLLPNGWTSESAGFIQSYFDQYGKKVKEDEKIKFSSARRNASQVPGRDIWRHWVTQSWKNWKIHARITRILATENLHPLKLALCDPTMKERPKASSYIPMALDAVGVDLFGDECLDIYGRLKGPLRDTTQALIQRTWINLNGQLQRSKARIVNLEIQAINAFESLDKDKPTKKKIMAVIIKVARWKNLAGILHTAENIEKMEGMNATLVELMVGLGAKLEAASVKPPAEYTKTTNQLLQVLASEEDVADVVAMYTEFFSSPDPSDSVDLREQCPSVDFQFAEVENGADPGVEVESVLSPDTLAQNLGFSSGLPLLFNAYRHRGGLSAWDSTNATLFDAINAEENKEMDKMVLHWHQLAGVHALIRMNFTPDPVNSSCCGSLIADEVGLGKTYQAGTTIAFLSDLVRRQEMNLQLPPIITSNPYLGTIKKLPDLAHLVVVPGTLLVQWGEEMKDLFKRNSVDIFMYGAGKALHESFWAPDGLFNTSKHTPSSRIILASHSALQQDFSSIYMWKKPTANRLPWADCAPLPSYKTQVGSTLYGQAYLSVTIDEAHAFRNIGAKHSSALHLLKLSTLRFIMTATPLQTSTKDIAGMGRLLGLPYFLSEEAFIEEKMDAGAIRRSKGTSVEGDPSADCQLIIARRMQHQFEGRILRRTIDSKNWRRESLIDIPPYIEVMVVVRPTPREMQIIAELADGVKEIASTSNSSLTILSRGFYLEHRMSVGYARLDLEEKIPTFKTLDEWEAKKSTKIDVCARLCRHLLTQDDPPEIEVKDGIVSFPEMIPGGSITNNDKIIIYQEFPSLGPLLRNVLDLYGIKHLFIDGQTTFVQRAKIVKMFCEESAHRVLIISSVGSTGLNLSVASKMIFLDQPWSAQDERQIRGRAHRQPQKKVVKCYHILADETADIVLSSLARGKKSMLDAFLEKDTGKEMYEIFLGNNISQPEDDMDESDFEVRELKREEKKKQSSTKKKSASKRKASNGKEQAMQEDTGLDVEITDAAQPNKTSRLLPVTVEGSAPTTGRGDTPTAGKGTAGKGTAPMSGKSGASTAGESDASITSKGEASGTSEGSTPMSCEVDISTAREGDTSMTGEGNNPTANVGNNPIGDAPLAASEDHMASDDPISSCNPMANEGDDLIGDDLIGDAPFSVGEDHMASDDPISSWDLGERFSPSHNDLNPFIPPLPVQVVGARRPRITLSDTPEHVRQKKRARTTSYASSPIEETPSPIYQSHQLGTLSSTPECPRPPVARAVKKTYRSHISSSPVESSSPASKSAHPAAWAPIPGHSSVLAVMIAHQKGQHSIPARDGAYSLNKSHAMSSTPKSVLNTLLPAADIVASENIFAGSSTALVPGSYVQEWRGSSMEIPSIRRPTKYGHHEGNISPPAAATQSKNPFTGTKRPKSDKRR